LPPPFVDGRPPRGIREIAPQELVVAATRGPQTQNRRDSRESYRAGSRARREASGDLANC